MRVVSFGDSDNINWKGVSYSALDYSAGEGGGVIQDLGTREVSHLFCCSSVVRWFGEVGRNDVPCVLWCLFRVTSWFGHHAGVCPACSRCGGEVPQVPQLKGEMAFVYRLYKRAHFLCTYSRARGDHKVETTTREGKVHAAGTTEGEDFRKKRKKRGGKKRKRRKKVEEKIGKKANTKREKKNDKKRKVKTKGKTDGRTDWWTHLVRDHEPSERAVLRSLRHLD